MTLDDLKRLNYKDPGSWPWAVKIGSWVILLILLIAGAAIYDWKDLWDQLSKAQAEETKLKDTFLAKKKEAVNLDLYRQQVKDIELSFAALLKELPNKSEMDALLIDINQAGLGRGLQFELFKPAPSERMSEFYAELPITIKVSGNYHDIAAFASDIAQLPRIVTLNDIAVAQGKDGRLVMDAVAKTYRYLDEEEIAKQKRAQQPAPKGKKK